MDTRSLHRARNRVRVGLASALVLAAAVVAPATRAATPVPRFALAGSAIIRPAASAQSGGTLELKASLGSGAATGASPPAGRGYTMTARLVAQPLVCASDTIFMDGFDG